MKLRNLLWLAALGAGLAAGLAFAWVVAPQAASGTEPRSLRSDYKDQLRQAIAASYVATGDLGRAHARLQLIGDADPVAALSGQAQRALASGQPFELAQELARLASDLQAGVSSLPSRTSAPILGTDSPRAVLSATAELTPAPLLQSTPAALATPEIPSTAFPTPSVAATPTLLPSPSAPFRLVSKDDRCDPSGKPGLLQVTVLDSKGTPLPGIEITVTWNQGTDRFFTGLQPEVSAGYADYTMKAGSTYALQVARLGSPVSGLTAPTCTSPDGQPYLGELQLTFAAP